MKAPGPRPAIALLPHWKDWNVSASIWWSRATGKRLAIECDGDRYYPLEKLPKTWTGSSVLERNGLDLPLASASFGVSPQTPLAAMKAGLRKSLEILEIPAQGSSAGRPSH